MTASELAKMLEGWPDGARLVGFDYDGGRDSYLYRPFGCSLASDCEGIPAMKSLIDLACMSGLRWLKKQKPGEKSSEPEQPYRVIVWEESVSLGYAHDDYYVHELEDVFTGKTTLHSIDAAIRATNPA